MWIAIIALSLLSGLLYRMGGAGDEGRKAFPWLPEWAFNTKARDVGCALCCGVATAFMFTPIWWAVLASFLLLFGALTTYWDFLWADYDNFWLHGFMCGLAYFPYAIASGDWMGFGARCVVLAIAMGGISAASGNDNVEEIGRGMVLPLTLPLMLV